MANVHQVLFAKFIHELHDHPAFANLIYVAHVIHVFIRNTFCVVVDVAQELILKVPDGATESTYIVHHVPAIEFHTASCPEKAYV
ncbi:MAG: hypothetical protein WCG25_04230 [bacterium]